MSNDRLRAMISAVCDGRASDTELSELSNRLRDDASALDEYLRYVDLHAALSDEVLPGLESDIIDYRPATLAVADAVNDTAAPAKHLRRYGRNHFLAIAASMIALVSMGAFAWMQNAREPSAPAHRQPIAAAAPVATLLFSEDCQWLGAELSEGQRLAPGKLVLDAGTAVMRFDGGAELVMKDATKVVLRSAGSAELVHGEVVVRAEDGAEGFQLGTPASPLVDLGTEFTVRVDRRGVTELHVLDGEVQYVQGSSPSVLSAGKAIRFTGSKANVQDVALNSMRFDEIIRNVNPKPQPQRMTVYEGFHYPAGKIALGGTTRGKGWAGPWRTRIPEEQRFSAEDFSNDFFDIVHGQMNVTWPVPGGRAGMLRLPSRGQYYVRPLQQTIDMDRDHVTFVSLMVRETRRRSNTKKRPYEQLRLTFRDSNHYYDECVSFGYGPTFRPMIQTGNGVAFKSPLAIPAEQTTLWMGKIVAREQGEDEIYFCVYGEADDLGYAEPATWHVISRGVASDARFDRVLLSSNGMTERIVDELRIGPTWRSVAPMLEQGKEPL